MEGAQGLRLRLVGSWTRVVITAAVVLVLWLGMHASDQRPPDLRLPWVALVGLQESAKGNGIAELVKDRLSFACAFEPVAEGDRIEFALEFL